MTFTLEKHKHLEGVPDKMFSGFANYSYATLDGGKTTLDVISEIRPNKMFSGYLGKRDELIELMLDEG